MSDSPDKKNTSTNPNEKYRKFLKDQDKITYQLSSLIKTIRTDKPNLYKITTDLLDNEMIKLKKQQGKLQNKKYGDKYLKQ